MRNCIQKHYHWVIAALVFVEVIVFGGLLNSASVFILPICASLEVSRSDYSMALVPYSLMCFVSNLVSGYAFQRFGFKKTAIFSLAMVAFSYVLTAVSRSLTLFSISKVLFATGYGACFTAGSVRIVKDWFWKHQGLVLGAVSMASGLGGSLLTIALTWIIQKSSWQTANLVAGATVVLIAFSFLLIKDRPEQKGLKPFGYGAMSGRGKKAPQQDHDWPGYTMAEQLLHPLFYIMCLCTLISCFCIFMTSGVVVVHFQDLGYSPEEAAMYQSVLMLCLAAGKLVAGGLCDRIGVKPVALFCMVCAAAGQLLISITADPVLCYIGVCLFAIGMCMTPFLIPLLATSLFGYQASLSVNGIFLAMSSLSNVFAVPVSNMFYDAQGSYGPLFQGAAACNLAVIGVYVLLFAMASREKKKYLSREAGE